MSGAFMQGKGVANRLHDLPSVEALDEFRQRLGDTIAPSAKEIRPVFNSKQVDWWQVVVDLERAGYSHASMAAAVGVPRTTLIGWKNLGAEPGFTNGERLVRLWSAVTSQATEEAPRHIGTLSAAALR